MSFQYTAPPQEITQAGQTATYLLYASLILVPKTRWAALIGGLGSATITYIVAGYAKGDMNALSYIIGVPWSAVTGAAIGAFMALWSKLILKLIQIFIARN
jgi:hypothetical protein